MKTTDIVRLRLQNQSISNIAFDDPADVVKWFGAVQAQDYWGALWAVGLRTTNASEQDVERALAARKIVRTWPMRGTLHFVPAEDIRWMLELLTPRVFPRAASLFRQAGLDDAVLSKSVKAVTKALRGGRQLTRAAMYQTLEMAGIATSSSRGLHILCWLAQKGVICFGTREGKQQTFTLLDEWVPSAKKLTRDEALAEIARRYFSSHGPATLHDFAWWTGLTVADSKAAVEMARQHLTQEVIGGQAYWLASSFPSQKNAAQVPSKAFLLPMYDEYTVAYKDRSAVLDPQFGKQVISGNGIFSPIMVFSGRVIGTWKRSIGKDSVQLTHNPFAKLKPAENRAFSAPARRYSEFLGSPVKSV